jgi:hypothetical protein
MLLSVEVPDQIAHSLRLDGPQSGRRALEMLALEGYRAGELSRGQVSKMLSLGFYETEGFLKAHKAHPEMTMEELEEERQALTSALGR